MFDGRIHVVRCVDLFWATMRYVCSEKRAFNQNIVHSIDISAILTLRHARASFKSNYEKNIKIYESSKTLQMRYISRATFESAKLKHLVNMFNCEIRLFFLTIIYIKIILLTFLLLFSLYFEGSNKFRANLNRQTSLRNIPIIASGWIIAWYNLCL